MNIFKLNKNTNNKSEKDKPDINNTYILRKKSLAKSNIALRKILNISVEDLARVSGLTRKRILSIEANEKMLNSEYIVLRTIYDKIFLNDKNPDFMKETYYSLLGYPEDSELMNKWTEEYWDYITLL